MFIQKIRNINVTEFRYIFAIAGFPIPKMRRLLHLELST